MHRLEAGLLLAIPTSFWQHHIEPLSAFPQQLLQVIKIFSLRPPTFLSIKTNELTLNKHPVALLFGEKALGGQDAVDLSLGVVDMLRQRG